jgi:hypothetical protein
MSRLGEARTTIHRLLEQRRTGATLCPSEAARALANDSEDWRLLMPVIHAAVDEMAKAGAISLSWKGATLTVRRGPYRIASPPVRDADR